MQTQMPFEQMPFEIGPIHFVGIGGIGMSGIAEVMLNLGYQVQGSDLRENDIIKRLRHLGATIYIGQKRQQVHGAGAVVVSTAIGQDNAELVEARALSIPVVRRAEMLAELMRLKWAVAVGGTHGKTTTTSMVAALLDGGGLDPTVINGGIINAYGANATLGAGKWMVVEADESDGSFLKLFPTVAIVTNIDPEHMEHYGKFENLRAAFDKFVENLPFYGFAVLCIDHPEVQALVSRVTDRKTVTYGFNAQADVRIENLRYENGAAVFDAVFRSRADEDEARWADLTLPMAGDHNAQNALAAIAVAYELGISEAQVRAALQGFGGVKRRFSHVGSWNDVSIIDDYGHHPVEIAAVLKAARQVCPISSKGKIHAVVQPHRYTRLQDLFDEFCTCFNDADGVYVTDVFEAGEAPIDGIDGPALVEGLVRHGHRNVRSVERKTLAKILKPVIEPGDYIVCLGAGDITVWAAELADKLAET